MHTLYLKTHNQTGLKYLGYHGPTNKLKFENYKGSGKYWKNHIEKHGYDVTTEVLCQASTSVERDGRLLAPRWFDDVCLEFSEMLNVVESDNFANLCHETGSLHTMRGIKRTQEWKDNHSKLMTGREITQDWRDKISESKKGYKHTDEARANMSKAQTGKIISDEQKANHRNFMMGKQMALKPNSIRQIWLRVSEAGEYPYSRRTFNRVYNDQTHKDHEFVKTLVQKHTIKE